MSVLISHLLMFDYVFFFIKTSYISALPSLEQSLRVIWKTGPWTRVFSKTREENITGDFHVMLFFQSTNSPMKMGLHPTPICMNNKIRWENNLGNMKGEAPAGVLGVSGHQSEGWAGRGVIASLGGGDPLDCNTRCWGPAQKWWGGAESSQEAGRRGRGGPSTSPWAWLEGGQKRN